MVEPSPGCESFVIKMSPERMAELGFDDNAYVKVEGRFQHHTVCMIFADRAISRKDVVQINKYIRINVRVKVGDCVSVSTYKGIKDAKHMEIVPFEETLLHIGSYDVYEKLLKPFFDVGRPVTVGDVFGIRDGSVLVEFRTMSMNGAPSAVVNGETVIQWSGTPVQRTVDETILDEVGYEDIGGCDKLLQSIRKIIEMPLLHPQLCKDTGSPFPTGILIVGPDGSGKKLIINAAAVETGAQLIVVDHLEITSAADSEESLRVAFEDAESTSPTIIFINKLDALAPNPEKVRLTQDVVLLTSRLCHLIENSKKKKNVVIMATSSHRSDVDPGIIAAFEWIFEISVPDVDARQEILRVHTRCMNLGADVDLAKIARSTKGFIGRNLVVLCETAHQFQIREQLPNFDNGDEEQFLLSLVVSNKNFTDAIVMCRGQDQSEADVLVPSISITQVAGYKDIIRSLLSTIADGGEDEETNLEFHVRRPKGIVMFGPPGCGKTQLVTAISNQTKRGLVTVKGPELISRMIGETEEKIRKKFQKAAENAPSLLLFDEIDSVGAKRDAVPDRTTAADRSVNELLIQMDALQEDVCVVGTTNRPDALDSALMRDGRLSHMVYLPVPDETSRLDIIKHCFRNIPLNDNVPLEYVAANTKGFTCADITGMCKKACKAAAEDAIVLKKAPDAKPDQKYFVEKEHIKRAMDSQHRTLTETEIVDFDLMATKYLKSDPTSSFQFPGDP